MTRSRPLAAIFNPQADRGRAAQAAEALQQAARGRCDLQLLETAAGGDAVRLAQRAADEGCAAVVAVGGDGTVHEVVNGLMELPPERRPIFAVLPAGSGNDVAYALDAPADGNQLVDLLVRGATRPVDVGRVRSSTGRACYWLNNVGTLLEGAINLASHRLRWPKGSGLYLRAALGTLVRKLPRAQLVLEIDGVERRCEAAILSVGNGPRSGGRFFLNPAARIDDGRLDYLLAPPTGRFTLLSWLRGVSRRERLPDDRLAYGQFQTMTVRSDVPLPIHVDGEPWITPEENVCELSLDVMPGSLQVLSSHPAGPACGSRATPGLPW